MDNYAQALENAKKHFCPYNMGLLERKTGVSATETQIITTFLGQKVMIDKATGETQIGGKPGNFAQCLTLFDWLCDGKPQAKASLSFCPVSSLPGVLVSGKGLLMRADALAQKADEDPQGFVKACKAVGGTQVTLGDMGFLVYVLPDLPMELKFYRSDEEFPASVTFLWDRNTLDFIRYETVYYLAGCLRKRLEEEITQQSLSL